MIPVDQTTFGHPGGNCFSACVASLLELPIAEVPYFMGDDWPEGFFVWLKPRGFHPMWFKTTKEWSPPSEGLCILGGQSSRGAHCVVGRGLTMIHDPHPTREGLVGDVEDVTYLVPLDPARAVGAPR